MLDMALDEAGITATPAIRVRTHFMAAELVRLGVGCAIVDALTVLHHPGLPRPCTLSPPLSVTCTVLYRADYALSHISRDILTLMRQELDDDLRALAAMI